MLETAKPFLSKTVGPVIASEQGEESNGNGNCEGGGRKRGRRERERRDQNIAATGENANVEVFVANDVVAAEAPRNTAPLQVKPSEYVAYPDSMKRLMSTEVVCYPTNAAPAEKSVEPVVQAAAPAPVKVDLSSAGLTMIETDPNKACHPHLFFFVSCRTKPSSSPASTSSYPKTRCQSPTLPHSA